MNSLVWPTKPLACARLGKKEFSSNDVANNVAGHIRQAEIAAAVTVGQLCVIEAEQMQNRGMQIVDVHGILDRLETKLVGRSVVMPPLTPPPASNMEKP